MISIALRRADLPSPLIQVIDSALSREPYHRPVHAGALRTQLIAALGRPASRYALVIGAPDAGLRGVEHDASAVAALLVSRGFAVTVCTGERATRRTVATCFHHLVNTLADNDCVVLYYAGRGFSLADGAAKSATFSMTLPGADGYELLELSLDALIARAINLTIITDACVAASGECHAPGLLALQISACGRDGVALEAPDRNGVVHGVFTEALVEVLQDVADLPFAWDTIGRAVRARVVARFPTQSPQFLGPVTRQPFSLTAGHDHWTYKVEQMGDLYAIAGGGLAGIVLDDRFAAMPDGFYSHAPHASWGELVVVEVRPTVALAHLVGRDEALPAVAVAIPLAKRGVQRPVAIDVRPVSQRFMQAVAAAPTLRIARPGEQPFATVRAVDGELTIDDEVGVLFRPGELGRQFGAVIRQLSNLAAAQSLRELDGEYGVAIDEADVTLGVLAGDECRPLPRHKAVLGLADQLCLAIANRSRRSLFVHVFSIEPRGRIRMVSSASRDGLEILPRARPLILRDIGIKWDPALPATSPRFVDFVVIVTTRPVRLDRLETDEARGNHRSMFNSALHDLLDQLYDGELREIQRERADDFFVVRLPYLLAPLDAELAGVAFGCDHEPLARVVARALRAGPESWLAPAADLTVVIEISVGAASEAVPAVHRAELDPRRIDAVIVLLSEDGTLIRRTACGDVGSTLQIKGSRIRGFLDIALFVSQRGGARPFADLLGAANAAPRGFALTASQQRTSASSVALALVASAEAQYRTAEHLRAVAGPTRCIYRAVFLECDNFGVGRQPTSGGCGSDTLAFTVRIVASAERDAHSVTAPDSR